MIKKIDTTATLNSQSKNPSFKSNPMVGMLQFCNTNPMWGVALIDGVTAIAPRTYVDAKTNGFAAAETFRRESSGLIVNCLIPGFFVLGVAKLMEMFKPKKDRLDLSNVWANEKSMTELHGRYKASNGNMKSYAKGIFKDMQVNVGNEWKSIGENAANKASDLITEIANGQNGKTKKNLKEVEELILKNAGGAEKIKLNGKIFNTNLTTLLRDTVDCGNLFERAKSKGMNLDALLKKSTNFINAKSLIGLAIVLPLAVSMQSINRWITKKRSGKEGAPIYKDFIKKDTKKMNEKEKAAFGLQKIGAAALMVGVAALSVMKKPSIQMLQFNQKLPTMDQCRVIATATFASRMLAAEDKNELREATVRDIATFGALYFFGDYVAKGVGSLIKKVKNIDLMNYKTEGPKKDTMLSKFKYWVTDTKLKSFDEVAKMPGAESKNLKNLRSACEISSLGFSMLLLGILVPWYVRKQTDKNEKAKAKLKIQEYNTYPYISHNNIHSKKAFQAFGMLEQGVK